MNTKKPVKKKSKKKTGLDDVFGVWKGKKVSLDKTREKQWGKRKINQMAKIMKEGLEKKGIDTSTIPLSKYMDDNHGKIGTKRRAKFDKEQSELLIEMKKQKPNNKSKTKK